ncbi:MAG: TolC family protein [Verrucomicrobiales bacterium]
MRAVGRRIDQANARLSQAGAALFPAADGTGEIRSRWDSGADRSDAASLGLLLDWEADVWGRLRSGKAARAQEAAAAYEDWRAARLLLTGAVAETWFELIEQRGQLRLAGEQIEVNRTLLELTRLRFGQGQSSVVAVLQQQEQLESTESRVPDIESRIAELELVLDTLAGRMPGGRKRGAGGSDLPVPPAAPAEGFPSDLLAERPDLRARRARIIALDHEVGEAIADRLPRFSVGGSAFADGAPSLDRVVAEAVAGVVGPIFDAGARKAEVARRRARVAEEIDLYTAEFLAAVREVETALVREGKLAERVRRQEAQLGTARRLLEESRNRYRQGVTDYLPVLDAVSTFQELERDVLTSRRERLSARVALHRALGGPMPMPEPPESGMNPESGAGH